MATKPKNLDQNINAVNTLNAIRNDIGGNYAADVPQALAAGDIAESGRAVTAAQALDRLKEIGSVITSYEAYTNQFLDQLVNRIAYTLLSSRLYRNPWATFKRGYVELGETVEEIFVNLADAHQFDPATAENEVFKREIPDVRAAFHTMNYQKFYKVTISRQELKLAFVTFEGLNNLVGKIIETLYTGANYDEFLMMKYLIAKNALNGNIAVKTLPAATLANADEIVSQFRIISQDVQYMSTEYNYAGVTTYSDLSSQRLILSNAFSGVIDVGSLARAYNMDKADFLSQTVGVNNFTFTAPEQKRLANLIYDDETQAVFTAAELSTLSTIQALLIDKDWFFIFDNEDFMDAQKNSQGMYWNHFYHVWKTFSTSPFNTAILFTTETPGVTAVTVTPGTANAKVGDTVAFTAAVTATGLTDKSVVWSVDSDNSSIDYKGVLTIGPNETKSSLTVTATSVEDSTKSGTATVTITT